MGKGDKKTKRGKISQGTFGVSRPRKASNVPSAGAKAEKTPKKATKKKSAK